MTWRFDVDARPADWARLGEAAYRNIMFEGEALTFPLVGAATTVASWEVIDHTGLTVATGSSFPAGTGRTWTCPVTLPCGWYRVLFTRATPSGRWGTSQGGGMFIVARQVSGMPPRPPVNLRGVARFDVIDAGLLSMCLIGPARLDSDILNPSGDYAVNDAAVDQLATYYTPYDTARPKPSLMAFPDGTDTTDPATATANIAAIVNRYPTVTHWEGQNEPQGNPDDSYVPVQQRFYQNVKAARSNAVVCGPAPVSIGAGAQGRLRAFLAANGGQWIDCWTVHTYNAHMGDLPTARRTWDTFTALLAEFGQQSKPRMNTEAASFFGAEFGAGQLPRQAHRTMLDLLVNEQYGVPKESFSLFYTTSHGFWDYPSFIENEGKHAFPVMACLLTHSQELLGTSFEARLDFGTQDNLTLIGSRYRRADGTGVVALMSAGRPAAPVTLQITGGSPTILNTVDAFGRTGTAPVTGGLAQVSVGTLPLYVRLPAGVTAVPVERALAPRTATATASVSGGPRGLGSPAQVVHGPWRNKLHYDAGNVADKLSVFESNDTPSPGAPVTFTVTLPTAVPADLVYVHCPPTWQANLSVIRDADVQILSGGAWTTVATIGYQPRVEEVGSSELEGVNGWLETWDTDVHVFEVAFSRANVTAVRLVVREVSAGGAPTGEALTGYGATDGSGNPITAGMGTPTPRLALQRVALFDSGSGVVGTGKYVVAVGALA